jgi:hypothetical protein
LLTCKLDIKLLLVSHKSSFRSRSNNLDKNSGPLPGNSTLKRTIDLFEELYFVSDL